jgi:3-isopropylmalate/(R)-2-methylmalate dehydratase large subunit
MSEGLFDIFLDANAVISPPTCGAASAAKWASWRREKRSIATTNRNFIGRMGHPGSEVYLANPAVAAASAVAGKIAVPTSCRRQRWKKMT